MKAYELLADRSKWTQRTTARTADQRQTGSCESNAACWCALGALEYCYQGSSSVLNRVIEKLAFNLPLRLGMYSPPSIIAAWNDEPGRRHAEVVKLLKALDL